MDKHPLLDSWFKRHAKDTVKRLARSNNTTVEMAEDAVQNACLDAILNHDSFSRETVDGEDLQEKFDAWMSKIVYNSHMSIINDDRNGGMSGRSL